MHCVLWNKDAPVLGKNSPQEVQEYIDKISTCEKPDPVESSAISSNNFKLTNATATVRKPTSEMGNSAKSAVSEFPDQ